MRFEKVFKLENGYILLYYHRPEWWRMAFLYSKFIIPMMTLVYLIRKNPFYKTYPAMMPIMSMSMSMPMSMSMSMAVPEQLPEETTVIPDAVPEQLPEETAVIPPAAAVLAESA